MEVVAFGVGDAEGVRDQRADRGLARAGYAHHHDDVGGGHPGYLAVSVGIGAAAPGVRPRVRGLTETHLYDVFKSP
ncbi:hypothetical protein GCM10010507_63160 [Streptomyces cinnamoneus]|uniref:Uncharacterized protein n=1 Tax=Streptomyces cinnamoneus TaxID=53446 RepID=A0A919C5X9_STRCJ|nr:hypothetical protein GCM10010507_63160 [Streptomyces cinnamoneus]